MITCGLDAGARTTKAVVLADGEVRARAIAPTGGDAAETANRVLAEALGGAGIRRADLAALVATGYGRAVVDGASATITEISCQARGVRHEVPGARGILDVGGQDSKAIALDADGQVRDFAMNDRCAAGTGRFLEVMASAFDLDLEETARRALAAETAVPIASTCTVFAESEIVSLRGQGYPSEAILAGIHAAVASRLRGMADRVAMEGPVAFTGGVARNPAAVEALRRVLAIEVLVPDHPQTTGALGAALLAADRVAAGRRA
jgi:predicted CoA-substrate-specific enzyme activase